MVSTSGLKPRASGRPGGCAGTANGCLTYGNPRAGGQAAATLRECIACDQARRRLRSELRALADLVNEPWRERVESELKWLAGLLGEVRDLDILLSRLRDGARDLKLEEVDRHSLAPLFTNVEARRAEAGRRVADSLESDRYRALLETLEQDAAASSARGSRRPRLPRRVAVSAKDAWRRLKKAARDLRSNDPAGEFHEARKRAKTVSLHGGADRALARPSRPRTPRASSSA